VAAPFTLVSSLFSCALCRLSNPSTQTMEGLQKPDLRVHQIAF